MKDMLLNSRLLPAGLSLFFLGVVSYMLYFTHPEDVGLGGVFLLFVLIFFFFFSVFEFFLRLKRSESHNVGITGVFAAIPTMLLGLQSLSQLQVRDVLIVFSLAGVVLFYWFQIHKKQ